MDMSILERSPDVAPLLVRLYDKHRLYGLAHDSDPMARAELATVMVDLLNIPLNPRESELMTDVLIGLMRQAERDLRVALSERLAAMDNVSLRMVLHLANDEIIVADPVLRKSPVLQDMDLIYIVKAKGPQHWQAIARRENISDNLQNILAETRDLSTALALAENAGIKLTGSAMDIFADMAETNAPLAAPLALRPELPEGLASRLYAFVGEELKAHLKEHFEIDAEAAEAALDDVILEFRNASTDEFRPSELAIAAAYNLARKDMLSVAVMIKTLRGGQVASFIAQMSQFCGLSADNVLDILQQEKGQGLALVCRAMGIMKADFVNMFLLTWKVRSRGGRTISQNDLAYAIRYFDKVRAEDARRILNQSRN